MIHLFLLLLFLLYRPLCPDGMLIVGWWSSSPQTEAKETLDSVPIELRFYSRPVVVSTLLVAMRPEAPPVALHSCLRSPLLSSLHPKRPDPPPARSHTIVLSPSLADPPALIGAGGALSVGVSETSLTNYL